VTSETTAIPHAARGDASPAFTSALSIMLVATATLAGAWFFQLVLEILPCPLCLEQRYAYYLSVPLAALVAFAAAKGAPRGVLLLGLALLALAALGTAGLGTYHSGVRMGILEGADRLHWAGRQSRQRRQSVGAARHR